MNEKEPPIPFPSPLVESGLHPATIDIASPPGHGKSTFFWALAGRLLRLHQIWPQCRLTSNPETRDRVLAQESQALQGELPPSDTPTICYDLYLRSLPRWGSRLILLRDQRDLYLASEKEAATAASKPGHASVLILLVDLCVPTVESATSLADLATRLFQAQDRVGVIRSRQRIVVALTKADRLSSLPLQVREYLRTDPFTALWPREEAGDSADSEAPQSAVGETPVALTDGESTCDVGAYMESLRSLHGELKEWLRTLQGGEFLEILDQSGADLRLCVTSATGSESAADGRMILPWAPRRIFDPFLWALELGNGSGLFS